MSKNYQSVKGTQDLFGEKMHKFQVIEEMARGITSLYNYKEIRIPEFEHTEVFAREGDSSDVVNKEMYTFEDQGGRSLSLRPEWTAGIIRSVVENKMYGSADLPLKYFYAGTCFRSENPQRGRYRIFNQFGIENIGVKSPHVDAEVISLGYTFLASLGLQEFVIELNTIGDKESRKAYNDALVKHFEPHIDDMCDDCKRRLKQNPLRILDCKIDGEKDVVVNAPMGYDYLNQESKDYYAELKDILHELAIPYKENPRLVRGLDYYSHTVFEFISTHPDMGAQSTILGGGHYDYLVEQFNGPEMAAVGFGMGIERLIIACDVEGINFGEPDTLDAYIMVLDDDARTYAMQMSIYLKAYGVRTEMDFQGRSFKAQFKSVDRLGAEVAIIIGNTEKENSQVTVKNTVTQEEVTVANIECLETVVSMIQENHAARQHNHECDGDCDCDGEHCDHDNCDCDHDHKH